MCVCVRTRAYSQPNTALWFQLCGLIHEENRYKGISSGSRCLDIIIRSVAHHGIKRSFRFSAVSPVTRPRAVRIDRLFSSPPHGLCYIRWSGAVVSPPGQPTRRSPAPRLQRRSSATLAPSLITWRLPPAACYFPSRFCSLPLAAGVSAEKEFN